MNPTAIDKISETSLPQRSLGRNGLAVSAIGLGCMGMSDFYAGRDEARAQRTLERAIERGITFFDTADCYGPWTNEELVGKTLAPFRGQVSIATKCGIIRDPNDPGRRGVDNRPEYIRACCEASLRRLGVETIDLFYLHRHNPDSAPIEDAVGAMAQLVREGKVRFIGLSEVSATTLERAIRVHPIAAVQSEYSLWSREPEADGVLATCRANGVNFVPYSPIGRGFLSGAIRKPSDFAPDDFRRELPRFQGENFTKNLKIVEKLESLAKTKGVTAVQLALAWVLAQGEDVVPIPGTTRVEHLDELIDATMIRLSPQERDEISNVFPIHATAGDRYYAAMRPFLGR